ncbi:MAG: phosphoadenosine phosphosulfate reductase family protein, partial [Lacisediminimonas sp.]|nr:phosphoadenosine phosphosulfate reductase family protein [Lacisediminimonas sp.]
MNAIELNARASSDFEAKLAETVSLLQQAARDYAPLAAGGVPRVSQASSLGAEDVVLSHLINSLQLDIGIFMLETGMLHSETLALLDRLKATSRAPVEVYTPVNESVVQFVSAEGKDA